MLHRATRLEWFRHVLSTLPSTKVAILAETCHQNTVLRQQPEWNTSPTVTATSNIPPCERQPHCHNEGNWGPLKALHLRSKIILDTSTCMLIHTRGFKTAYTFRYISSFYTPGHCHGLIMPYPSHSVGCGRSRTVANTEDWGLPKYPKVIYTRTLRDAFGKKSQHISYIVIIYSYMLPPQMSTFLVCLHGFIWCCL